MQTVVDFTALSAVIKLAEVCCHRFFERCEAEMFFVMHLSLLRFVEPPTFHIGDDFLLERYRIILLERHDHRHPEACALHEWQATVDHGSAALLLKVFVDGMVSFEA
jgi:hypothetical protein